MIKDIELTEEQAGNISRQLYKYYDIEGDVQLGCCYYENDNMYRIYLDDDRGIKTEYVRFRKFENSGTIEDLYIVDCVGGNIEPTTTLEEQENR